MLTPDTLLAGRYRIQQQIGTGGMGTVYAAHDERLGRDVAIKLLRPDAAADAKARQRFLTEGQIAAQVIHPNIVRTYDAGDDPVGPFLVQELLQGQTLDQQLPQPVPQALAIAQGIAAALGALHERGYVHCDVKPHNILIRDNGDPVLLDFGIARSEGTDTTTLIATPHYLAPERVEGKPPTPATDLYALGIVLFQMLTGRVPFDGQMHEILQAQRTKPIPALGIAEPAAPALDRVIARLAAKNPADRYRNADSLIADLRAVGNGQPLGAGPDDPTLAVPNGGATSLPPQPTAPPFPEVKPASRAAGFGWHGPRWVPLLAIPLLVLGGAMMVRGRSSEGNATTPTPAATTVAPATTTAPADTSGLQQVAVPNVVGQSRDEAAATLLAQNLTFALGGTAPDASAAGTVIRQDPEPNTQVIPKTVVQVTISSGPGADAQQPAQQPASNTNDGKDNGKGKDKDKDKGKKK